MSDMAREHDDVYQRVAEIKNNAMVKITLPENHQVHASRSQLYLPTEDELREELEREREEAERTLRLSAAESDDGDG